MYASSLLCMVISIVSYCCVPCFQNMLRMYCEAICTESRARNVNRPTLYISKSLTHNRGLPF